MPSFKNGADFHSASLATDTVYWSQSKQFDWQGISVSEPDFLRPRKRVGLRVPEMGKELPATECSMAELFPGFRAGLDPSRNNRFRRFARARTGRCAQVYNRVRLHVLTPDQQAADERILVAADDCALGAFFQLLDVATAQYDIVGAKRRFQHLGDFANVLAPALFSKTFQAAQSQIVLVGFAFLVAQVRELHRLKHAVHDHRGAESGAEAEKQHPATLVAADGLHRRVVDQFHRHAERFVEIEADPSATEIVWLAQWAAVDDRAGVTERDAVVIPALGFLFDDFDSFLRGHRRAGRDLGGFLLALHAHFYMGAADIDDKDLQRTRTGLVFRLRFLGHSVCPLGNISQVHLISRGATKILPLSDDCPKDDVFAAPSIEEASPFVRTGLDEPRLCR